MTNTEFTIIKAIYDADGGVDIKVDSQIESEDKLVVMLLLVVEKMTGVSTDDYVAQIDGTRRSS